MMTTTTEERAGQLSRCYVYPFLPPKILWDFSASPSESALINFGECLILKVKQWADADRTETKLFPHAIRTTYCLY
jgi:hypothetical protein